MNNILIIGGNGSIGSSFLAKYGNAYDNMISVDRSYLNNFDIEKNLHKIKIDVTNNDDLEKLTKYIVEHKLFPINKVVYSAGINSLSNFFTISGSEWENTMNVNVKGFLFTLKSVYDFLSSKTSIVVVGSQNGIVGHEDRIDYGPSKAALIQMIKNLSIDFLKDYEKDIQLNAVSPSYIITEANSEYLNNSLEGKKLLKKIPYKKFVNLNDVICIIDFLLDEKSKAIRGQNIVVDYGYTII